MAPVQKCRVPRSAGWSPPRGAVDHRNEVEMTLITLPPPPRAPSLFSKCRGAERCLMCRKGEENGGNMGAECKQTFAWRGCLRELVRRRGSATILLTKNNSHKRVELSVISLGGKKKTHLDWFWYFWGGSNYMLLLLTLMKYSETDIDSAAWLFFQGRSIPLQLVSIFIPVSGALFSRAINFNYRSLYGNWLIWITVVWAISKTLPPFLIVAPNE